MLRIALDGTGTQFVNAGHPWPLRLRGGVVEELRPAVDFPFGFAGQGPHRVLDWRSGPGRSERSGSGRGFRP
ncbi:hypothetical protein [Herbidospora galbida]|uniref:hypothetical protein n=1 Tax=Herbidospora galbida TaxID=2575442 RepID=UPI00248275C2|nr:hypothetical protein [Herbidospora galbida]